MVRTNGTLSPPRSSRIRLLHWGVAALVAIGPGLGDPALADPAPAGQTAAAQAPADRPIPSFKELEAQGATIGRIRVDPENIFDLSNPRENNSFYRLANRLHIKTRAAVIERFLLFKSGERVSAGLIDETERLMRGNHFLYDVQIKPVAYHDGVVDIDVITRDTWTLDLTGRYGRAGGSNSTSFGFLETNLLGTGTSLGLSQSSDVDRHGQEFQVSNGQLFDGWTAASYQQAHYNDGNRYTASLVRPFYALETRWSAGVSWDQWNRIDSVYNASETVNGYRHHSKIAEAFGGWSRGLVNGWTQRFSGGVALQDDAYAVEPGQIAPAPFPADHAVRGLFARYEVVEDRYVTLFNRNQIARPEYFEMGLHSTLQVTRSLEAWGASRSAWLYSASVSRGFMLPRQQDLLATVTAQRQMASTGEPLNQVGTLLNYYAPQNRYAAFYGSLSADRIGDGAAAPDELLLGGDNGLRGYPLRYQSGTRRALLTLEQRVYSDWYPFHLVRVGGAAFYDRGRAWGGVNQNAENGGWLSDVGVGLRLAFDRAAFGNVLHADIAMPLQRTPSIKKVQFIVKTELTF